VISELGMRSYFRDLFIQDFNTQKLGGYDPYMNEYVLSGNTIKLPAEEECLNCQTRRIYNPKKAAPVTFCVDLGDTVGDVTVTYNVTNIVGASTTIQATYDGIPTSSGAVGLGTGSFTFNKNKVGVDKAFILLTATGEATIDFKISCPDALGMVLVQVTLNANDDAGELIHNEYRWNDPSYVSPLHSNQVELESSLTIGRIVSEYRRIPTETTPPTSPTVPQGGGVIPADGATVTVRSNRITASGDNFDFNPTQHRLMYLRQSFPELLNTPVDITAMLAAATQITPVTGGPDLYEGTFTMPTSSGEVLYLIYDYRDKQQVTLCYGATEVDACCDC